MTNTGTPSVALNPSSWLAELLCNYSSPVDVLTDTDRFFTCLLMGFQRARMPLNFVLRIAKISSASATQCASCSLPAPKLTHFSLNHESIK